MTLACLHAAQRRKGEVMNASVFRTVFDPVLFSRSEELRYGFAFHTRYLCDPFSSRKGENHGLKRFDFNLIYHIKSKRPLRLDVAPRFCSNPDSGLRRNALATTKKAPFGAPFTCHSQWPLGFRYSFRPRRRLSPAVPQQTHRPLSRTPRTKAATPGLQWRGIPGAIARQA